MKNSNLEEKWAPINGYIGLYEVSNYGAVRSLYWKGGPKYLRLADRGNGYLFASLCKSGVCRSTYVHRLVAEEFVPNTKNKKYINHKDGNKKNNRQDNLEWVTGSENIIHAFETGLNPGRKGRIKRETQLIGGIILYRCSRCGGFKPKDEFRSDRTRLLGIRYACAACDRKRERQLKKLGLESEGK